MTGSHEHGAAPPLLAEWPFPTAAALGSSVRAEGIVREIRGRLAFPDRKHLTVQDGIIRLLFENGQEKRLEDASTIVGGVLSGVETLPLLPREVDDILTILPRERLKWTRDGRLQSAGTRTVKLRGRAKAVTFHVFDPGPIVDILDRDLPAIWRAEDAAAAAENRRRAAGKAALLRGAKTQRKAPAGKSAGDAKPRLKEWDAFDAEGFLR